MAFAVILSVLLTLSVDAASVTSTASITGNTITVTASPDFIGDIVSTLRVTDKDGNQVAGIDKADITPGIGSFTVDVTAEAAALTSGIFNISFITTAWAFSSAIFVTDNQNQVQVTANVLPILSMKIDGAAIAFGDLVADTAATATVNTAITVNTNAANGYTMQVANTGLKDGAKEIEAATAGENISTGSGYGYGINATVDAGVSEGGKSSAAGSIATGFVGTDSTSVSGLSSSASTVSSSTGPVSTQVTTIKYHARISALQETGNYTDTVTYSLTSSF